MYTQKQSRLPYDLSIVIPAYNEEKHIETTLHSIYAFAKNRPMRIEIIVINDCSADRTAKIVATNKKMIPHLSLYSLPKNRGKGYAVKTGVKRAQGRLILIMDADHSTPIEEYDVLFHAVNGGCDIAVGSRALAKSRVHIRQSFYRIILGRAGNLLIRLVLWIHIKDTQCGFKLFQYQAAQDIFSRQKIERWGFDIETIALAKHLGYTIAEVPVRWYNKLPTRVRAMSDGLRTLYELGYIKYNLLRGTYHKPPSIPNTP